MLNEFGARGRQGRVRRWGRLLGPALRLGGSEKVVAIAVDGVAEGFAPAVRAERVDVFLLGDMDGLQEGLGQVGDGVGGFGFYIAADNGRDEACQGGAEIAGGEVVTGEEVVQVFAEFLRGAGAGFFLGVVGAEAGIVAGARSAATAAIRESERTQGHAVLCTERGHKSLLRVEFWDLWGTKAGRAEARPYTGKPGVQNRNAPARPRRSIEHGYCTTTVLRVKLKNQGQKKEKSKPAVSAKPSGAQKTRLGPTAAGPRANRKSTQYQKFVLIRPSACEGYSLEMRFRTSAG